MARRWPQQSRRLLVSFAALTVCLTLAFAGLSWRLLAQERELERQRLQERLEHAADAITTALIRSLAADEATLQRLARAAPENLEVEAEAAAAGLGSDAALVVFGGEAVRAFPRGRLVYLPVVTAPREPGGLFAEAERLELVEGNHDAAVQRLTRLARTEDPQTRAGALLRLARNLRKGGRHAEAHAAYGELESLGTIPVEGLPSALLGRYGRCSLLAQQGDLETLRHEARSFLSALLDAEWSLERSAYHFYVVEATRWLDGDDDLPVSQSADRLALSGAVVELWEEWQGGRVGGASGGGGRRVAEQENRFLLVQWSSAPSRLVALVSGPRQFESRWAAASALLPAGAMARLPVQQDEVPALDRLPQLRAVRTSADVGLPWPLVVSSPYQRESVSQFVARRALLLAGLGAMMLLTHVAGYLTARAVARELAVTRLQSDFVSAVSHELRSPLSTLRQISEMLGDGRVAQERRQRYYEQLQWEVARLQRLVENLLDLTRMEAGVREYRRERVELSSFVREVADEFQRELSGNGVRVDVASTTEPLLIMGEREALAQVLWNLFDNAAKYSPEDKSVVVRARRQGDFAALSVTDKGVGIDPAEHELIFRKFNRASNARETGAKGVGLGLAMARQIVEAHGGAIAVESSLGRGSTFTVRLPVEAV